MSTSTYTLHNDHHVITEIPKSIMCLVLSFKMYLELLNPDSTVFFQYPNKNKNGFTKELVRKSILSIMKKEIFEKAGLSHI